MATVVRIRVAERRVNTPLKILKIIAALEKRVRNLEEKEN
jgi:hypothetical protein